MARKKKKAKFVVDSGKKAGSGKKDSDKKADKKADKKKDSDKGSDKSSDKAASNGKTPRATTMAATEIIPNLFVGTREDAEAIGERVPDGWVCISVTEYRSRYKRTEELPYEPIGSLDMPFMADWPDGWHADPHKLDLIAEIIWWKLQLGKKVLVHCIHAQERSPLAAAWYLAWSGAASSMLRAYEIVEKLHPRTQRRDKWLRGSSPGKLSPDLATLLDAARTLAAADPQRRTGEIGALETAAIAWAAPPRSTSTT
jgi:hypothetical protein